MRGRPTKRTALARALGATAVMAFGVWSPAQAQTIRGIVIEAVSYRPIVLAEAYLLALDGDTVAAALSNEEGVFSLTAPAPGEYRVQAQALGYFGRGAGPFELDDDALQVVQLELRPAPVPIEGIDVETTAIVISDDELLANGFYERMRTTRGQFLTPEAVERSGAHFTPQLFRELKYVIPQYGASGWLTWPRVFSPLGKGGCVPRVWVDGVWVNRPRYEQFLPGQGLEDVVPRESIKAVELYWGMQAPLRYRNSTGYEDGTSICGSILIWTK